MVYASKPRASRGAVCSYRVTSIFPTCFLTCSASANAFEYCPSYSFGTTFIYLPSSVLKEMAGISYLFITRSTMPISSASIRSFPSLTIILSEFSAMSFATICFIAILRRSSWLAGTASTALLLSPTCALKYEPPIFLTVFSISESFSAGTVIYLNSAPAFWSFSKCCFDNFPTFIFGTSGFFAAFALFFSFSIELTISRMLFKSATKVLQASSPIIIPSLLPFLQYVPPEHRYFRVFPLQKYLSCPRRYSRMRTGTY